MSFDDSAAREKALDPSRSFIVQAPAGSGKTSLLSQRFLTLLGGVAKPEEVLAITFTRKAAGEMRERIVSALRAAQTAPEPEEDYLYTTWSAARQALQRDEEMDWQLLKNPNRLQIMTIDSLCTRLARALPVLSQFGASPQATDDASEYYQEAARRTLALLHQSDDERRNAVATLLLHLDNDINRVQGQVSQLLIGRDKWMRPLLSLFGDLHNVGQEALREALENTLSQVVCEHLSRLKEAIGRERLQDMAALASFCGQHVDSQHPLHIWKDAPEFLGTDGQSIAHWSGLTRLFLTNKGQWRKNITKAQGLLPSTAAKNPLQASEFKAQKLQAKALLAELVGDEKIRLLLHEVPDLPPERYSDNQWYVLRSLLEVSRLAAAQLTLVFRDRGQSDFVEISHRAERALGTDLEPTDLAMALDSKIQHLLVDEFQDTSVGQLNLLKRLTAEWVPGEGRTLFLVGDPMQSIYRFRDAEVGLFLKVRREGLGHLQPEPLVLRSNFRSQAGMVDWFNDTFRQVFPKVENPGSGSVPYSEAQAAREAADEDAVDYWPVGLTSFDFDIQRAEEAEAVLKIIESTWKQNPEADIAILVRSRTHLQSVLPLLRKQGLRFQGVDLEPLSRRPAVRDLFSLTRALIDAGDRVAWLSLLRCPLLGLDSADIFCISEAARFKTIPKVLARIDALETLSDPARQIISRVWPILDRALYHRRRKSLRQWIEATWLSLGGPAGLAEETDLADCQTFLSLLDQLDDSKPATLLTHLETRLDRLFAEADVLADGRLQIMTIHKSKGLEFDTVILPGLSNTPRPLDEPLVSWLEWTPAQGYSQLLLAPITERGRERDPVYRFVHNLEKKKEENESVRLLYVAATRAKRKLHLVGRISEDKQKDYGTLKAPRRGSFLELLWPSIEADFTEAAVDQLGDSEGGSGPRSLSFDALQAEMHKEAPGELESAQEAKPELLSLRRLNPEWEMPELPAELAIEKADLVDDESEDPKFEWASETVKHVGTVVHRVLQQVGREGHSQWSKDRLQGIRSYLYSRLRTSGVPPEQMEQAVARSFNALSETLSSSRGRWILDPKHREARSEFAISGIWRGGFVRSVVDRTFVDKAGTRWVIDYKTSSHEGADVDDFVDREVKRYKPQLKRYARLLNRLDDRPVKMGLYFPLLKAWREWSLEEDIQPVQLELFSLE